MAGLRENFTSEALRYGAFIKEFHSFICIATRLSTNELGHIMPLLCVVDNSELNAQIPATCTPGPLQSTRHGGSKT